MLLPIPLLLSGLLGLLALAAFIASLALLYRAGRRWVRHDRLRRKDEGEIRNDRERRPIEVREWWKENAILVPLIAGVALLLFTFAGGPLFQLAYPSGPDEPQVMRTGEPKELTMSDGARIHAELYGPAAAPTLLFTHGWGTNSTEWYYAKKQLGDKFRLILWDLPGLGESTQPNDRNYSLERMASDLHAVLALANGKPVVLVGHSIGGMINLTFCRLYPEALGPQVTGVVELDTSYTNPVKTTKGASFSLAIQKPIGEPVLHAMILLSPFVRLMNWMSYQNGSAQMMNAQSSFAGSETRGQINLVSKYQYESSPAVVARGTLAMFHWDATPVLPRINIPVLIVVGQQDTTTLPSASEYMHANIPNSTVQVVNPSAHYGLLEQNAAYNQAIAQFASKPL